MICPYNRAKQTQVMQYTNDLVDEDGGIIRGYQHIVTDSFEMIIKPLVEWSKTAFEVPTRFAMSWTRLRTSTKSRT